MYDYEFSKHERDRTVHWQDKVDRARNNGARRDWATLTSAEARSPTGLKVTGMSLGCGQLSRGRGNGRARRSQ